ncbi:MAG: glycosyltransferase family 4 protein [Ilumatobacteraceae bacterium]
MVTRDSDRSLRIGLVCPYSLTVPGGVQGQVLGLARQLRRLGHEARVLGPCDGPPPEPFVTPLGNSLSTAANGSIAPLAPDASCALRTIRALNDEEFDIVHVHEPLAPGPTLTSVLMHPAPMVGTFHAAGRSSSYQVFARQLAWAAGRIERKVVVSAQARELVHSHLGGEYDVLFNGVELDAIASTSPTPTAAPTIFFCGRHEERKGLAVLLEAFRELPATVRLWIASDGPDGARLRAEHGDDKRITWLGRISDAEKFARLRAAAAFCAPSLHGESFGVVLIEAMAAGTPVVASAIDGYRDVGTNGLDALLVEPGDATALAEALSAVIDDTLLADSLREAGRRRAQEFSMATLAAAYTAIYRELLVAAPVDEPSSRRRRAWLPALRAVAAGVAARRPR